MAGHPLRPATRRRLGTPLPHQQADRPRAHPIPPESFPPPVMQPEVLFGIRPSFPGLSQSMRQVTHVLLTRSPLTRLRRNEPVRLACVKHAASVRPEPGSNSPNKPGKNNSKNPDEGIQYSSSTGLNRHTVEFSNNTRTPITRLNQQTRSEGQLSSRLSCSSVEPSHSPHQREVSARATCALYPVRFAMSSRSARRKASL